MNKNGLQDKDKCFVIMPFSTEWSEDYYSEIYCQAINKAGLTPHRADDLFGPNNVVEDIWRYTQSAKIILADLTGKNPNVFYELGLAHAIAKPVILITESEEDIPFDLRAIRIIKYDKNKHDWGDTLKKSITNSINEILKSPEKSIPFPFLKTSPKPATTLSPSDKELVELKQEVELIRKELHSRPRRVNSRVDIGPEQAKELIYDYVKIGLPEEKIIERLLPLGPPISWVRAQIERLKSSPEDS